MTATDVFTLFSHKGGTAKSQLAGNGSAAGQTRWGGWGSNPRPADYEDTGLAGIGAGRAPSVGIGAGQPGSSRMGRDRPERVGMGRMFPFCSHQKAGPRVAGLHVVAVVREAGTAAWGVVTSTFRWHRTISPGRR